MVRVTDFDIGFRQKDAGNLRISRESSLLAEAIVSYL